MTKLKSLKTLRVVVSHPFQNRKRDAAAAVGVRAGKIKN
jgi:hypothetical protein